MTTNEEWLKSLPIEELTKRAMGCTCCVHHTINCLDTEADVKCFTGLEEWLKQEHKE